MSCNYFGLKGLRDLRLFSCVLPSEEYFEDSSEMHRLVQLVYAPDKRTGLASSELSVLVSDSVPPQIAEWVRNQILRPVGFAPSSIKNGQQIDDDTLFALTRDMNETNESYVNRVDNLLRQWNTNNEGD